jgi:hypothetical protein
MILVFVRKRDLPMRQKRDFLACRNTVRAAAFLSASPQSPDCHYCTLALRVRAKSGPKFRVLLRRGKCPDSR